MIGCIIKFKALPGRRFKVGTWPPSHLNPCSECAFQIMRCKQIGARPLCEQRSIIFKEVK